MSVSHRPGGGKPGGVAGILVADDNVDMRLLVRMVIEMAGEGWKIVAEAADGVEAVERWRELSGSSRPDVVILDNRMPRADGLEVAQQILQERPEQIVVLYSTFLNDDMRSEAAHVGIAACVTKGDLQALPRTIRGLMAATART